MYQRIKNLFTMIAIATVFIASQLIAAEQPLNFSINSLHALNKQHTSAPPSLTLPPPKLNVAGYVLIDAKTGAILASYNANKKVQPASLTKLMTLYITFQALKSGQIHLDDKVHISKKAWRTGGSRMFLKVGSDVTVRELIQGVIVASGNDACVALAQYIAGTEQTFAQIMNQTAQRLGMNNSHYIDSTGLPREGHYSTPYDMALLARAIINDFPDYYHFFAEKWITYNNIKQPNRNRLLWRDKTVDGLKTGHTNDAGYCLIASAKRGDMRLISVIMGAPTDSARASDSEALLNYGFRFYKTVSLFTANQILATPRVWFGKQKNIKFGLHDTLSVMVPAGEVQNLKAALKFDGKLTAPIIKGQRYGHVQITLHDKVIVDVPVVALENDPKAGFFSRLGDRISMLVKRIF